VCIGVVFVDFPLKAHEIHTFITVTNVIPDYHEIYCIHASPFYIVINQASALIESRSNKKCMNFQRTLCSLSSSDHLFKLQI
jgi:hypothetical protein